MGRQRGMNEALLKEYYKKRGFGEAAARRALKDIKQMEAYLTNKGFSFEAITIKDIREYINSLIISGINSEDCLLALARYFYLIGRKDAYVYFASLLGGAGVMENIAERLTQLEGRGMAGEVFSNLRKPPLGADPKEYPEYTGRFMARLEAALPPESVKKVLAGNNHGIAREAYLGEKALYEKAASLDAYLEDYQRRQIEELQEYCEQNKIWYEQKITQEVVDFAASNQEIMSAVRWGDALFVTKIPYDPEKFLQESDPTLKRYYACHCPFAREAILNRDIRISSNWCYCSAGYAKYPYEIIFGRELKVEMLASALKGDLVCRFAIDLGQHKQ
jgi:hypothetical protein